MASRRVIMHRRALHARRGKTLNAQTVRVRTPAAVLDARRRATAAVTSLRVTPFSSPLRRRQPPAQAAVAEAVCTGGHADWDSLAARDAMLCRCGIPCSFSDNAEAECEACLQRALQVDSTHFDAHLQVCTLVVTLERSARADQCTSHWRCDRAVGAGVVHRSCIHRSDHGHRPLPPPSLNRGVRIHGERSACSTMQRATILKHASCNIKRPTCEYASYGMQRSAHVACGPV